MIIERMLYTSPKNTFQKLHFPEKQLAETTLSQTYISQNFFQKLHFPEHTLARNYIFLNMHLQEITFS